MVGIARRGVAGVGVAGSEAGTSKLPELQDRRSSVRSRRDATAGIGSIALNAWVERYLTRVGTRTLVGTRAFPARFARLLTTAISSLGFAGFDRYIWNPAPRMVTRSSILA